MSANVTAALTNVTQTTVVTLANLSFNFALWKRDAPVEYQPLRKALTARRQESAETGTAHMTARKLGSLFEPALPEVPNLYRAYGLRASEIATERSTTLRAPNAYGPFAQHAGIDGTTLWAAATAGDGAIAVHLLACMLARQLPADEATAAWEELVTERKEELRRSESRSGIHIEAFMASRIEITTEELAVWDAGARAWLAAADEVNRRRQKQLMLILNNLHGVIGSGITTYTSVMAAWCKALEVVDKLISGAAHVVQDWAVLLGISSWHLFPDMTILGGSTQQITFNDSLLKAGSNLTVGIKDPSYRGTDHGGVYWSLPLSRLRYYGDTQTTERSLRIDTSQVPFDQFQFVALGCASSHWTPTSTSINEAANFFLSLESFFKKECDAVGHSWPRIFAVTASRMLQLDGLDRDYAEQLFKLGRRNPSYLRAEEGTGLFDDDASADAKNPAGARPMQFLTRLLKNKVSKMEMLKAASLKRLAAHKDHLVIRTAHIEPNNYAYQFAVGGHTLFPKILGEKLLKNFADKIEELINILLPPGTLKEPAGFLLPLESQSAHDIRRFIWLEPPTLIDELDDDGVPTGKKTVVLHSRYDKVSQPVEQRIYQFLYGDKEAAIFSLNRWTIRLPRKLFGLQDILQAFQNGWVDPVKLLQRSELHLKSIRAFAAAASVFQSMPDAGVSLAGLSELTLGEAKWAAGSRDTLQNASQQRILESSLGFTALDRSSAYACICMLTSGTLDLDPAKLSQVLAISSADSLFVSEALIDDPYTSNAQKIVRIPGNIGRAGVALLIPPRYPMVQKPDPKFWAVISHRNYDGRKEDSFEGTNMMLRFTDFESPADDQRSGEKFKHVYFIESVVSVFDRGVGLLTSTCLAR